MHFRSNEPTYISFSQEDQDKSSVDDDEEEEISPPSDIKLEEKTGEKQASLKVTHTKAVRVKKPRQTTSFKTATSRFLVASRQAT